jgi:hypothetical protein
MNENLLKEEFVQLQKKYIENFQKNSVYSSLKDLQVNSSKSLDENPGNLGVFAKRNFSKNELIECSPIFNLDWRSKYQNDIKIKQYAFTNNINCKCADCKTHGYVYYIALGYASIYNSKKDADAHWFLSPKDRAWFLVAIKNIKRGDEIFTYYGDAYNLDLFKNKQHRPQTLDEVDWSKIPLTPTN